MGPIDLKISELSLDLQNPRIITAHSQREALQRILDDQKEKLVVLARDIVAEGVSPMERLLVLSESKRHVVLEGNRRVAALKILATPSLLNELDVSKGLKKSFDKAAAEFDISSVEPLACFEVDDREAGNRWIQLRHTGENGGKGIVAWGGIERARFRGRDPALQALTFVQDFGGLSADESAALEGFPITTLDRLLSTKDVRKRLGFDVKDHKLLSGLPPVELMKPLKRMVLDLAQNKVNVTKLKLAAQQREYVESFDAASKPDLSKAGDTRPVEDITATDFAANKPGTGGGSAGGAGEKKKKKKKANDPSKRRTLVPRNVQLDIKDNRVAAIFGELRDLRVDDSPNAVAVLFRVFLELSVDRYLEKQNIPLRSKDTNSGRMHDKSLKAKVQEAIDDLVAKGSNRKDFGGVSRALNVNHSPMHMDLLNDYVHNRFVTPKTHDLMASWNDAQRFFEGLWT